MPRARPGSWRWLLAHEMRLWWRMSNPLRSFFTMTFVVILFVAMHLAAWFIMGRFDEDALLAAYPLALAGAGAFVLLLMLSTAFGLAVVAIFERGDLDLLLSSPLSPATVQSVRGAGVALYSVAFFAFSWLPFAHMGAWHGRIGMLLGYPVLLAAGLGCAAAAFTGTLWLVRRLGVRRARVLSQIVGAFLGAGLLLVFQAESLLPREVWRSIIAFFGAVAGSGLAADSLLTWPARAMLGEPLPALAIVALGAGAFALSIRMTAGLFAQAAQGAGEVAPGARRVADGRRSFHGGLERALLRKELLLIARDPVLISKALLQVLYLLPLFAILLRSRALAEVLAPSLIVLAASLAGNLAWITVSGEEAPDLVGSAPISQERVRWLKAAAAVIPSFVVSLPFLAWYASASVALAATVAAYLALAIASSAVMQVWTGQPGSKRDLKARVQGNVMLNVLETFSSLAWAFACYLTLRGSAWALAPAAAALVGPVGAWLIGKRRSDRA